MDDEGIGWQELLPAVYLICAWPLVLFVWYKVHCSGQLCRRQLKRGKNAKIRAFFTTCQKSSKCKGSHWALITQQSRGNNTVKLMSLNLQASSASARVASRWTFSFQKINILLKWQIPRAPKAKVPRHLGWGLLPVKALLPKPDRTFDPSLYSESFTFILVRPVM